MDASYAITRVFADLDRHAQVPSSVQAGHGLEPEIERVLQAELHALRVRRPAPAARRVPALPRGTLAARVEPRIDALCEERQSRRARRVPRGTHHSGRDG
jgi:hypothetical protein